MIEDSVKNADISDPLNPQQVERISALHRGFLYQHLYGVACLLTVLRSRKSALAVELDEDLELSVDGERHYVQVKTRNRDLQPADIESSIEQFEHVRKEHVAGRRSGKPILRIITNTGIGPTLSKRLIQTDWPSDVLLIEPRGERDHLPPAWSNLDDAFDWCVEQAQTVPFGDLAPETLVWKLAARVLHAGSQTEERIFRSDDIQMLLEQLVVQLQDFPDPPSNYRPQLNEPPLSSEAKLRLVVGFSGSGKTAWASQAALHCPQPIAYIDVSDMPAASVATNVARELAARFIGGGIGGLGGASLSDQAGLNVLRACDRKLNAEGISVQVILDNSHTLSASGIRSLVEAAPSLRFLCLAQPWQGQAEIEALFSFKAERLEGWSADDIAAEFKSSEVGVTVADALRVQKVSGGLPLFVKNAALVTARDYSGDVEAFCDAIEGRTNDQEIAQEIILSETFAKMDEQALKLAAILSLAEIPVGRTEIDTWTKDAGFSEVTVASLLKKLRRSSIVIGFQGDRLGLHDAIRPLAADARTLLTNAEHSKMLATLSDLLIGSLAQRRDVARLGFLMRLLPRIGKIEALVDMAGHEMFHEQGDPRSLRRELEAAAADENSIALDRFWANDAVAYWETRDGGVPSAGRLKLMSELIETGSLGSRERLSLHFKELVLWADKGDRESLNSTYATAMRLKVDDVSKRLLRYNFALCLDRIGAVGEARQVIDVLINEYFEVLNISERSTFGKSNIELFSSLPTDADTDDMKRLADSLALWSHIVVKMGEPPLLRRITAIKFYGLAQAARSVVSTGLEAVDDFLVLMADPVGARETIEQHVLPVVRESQLTELVLPSRSVYAIVLAWNGAHDAALAELAALREYAVNGEERQMLDERSEFVSQIISGEARLQRQVPPPGALSRILGSTKPTAIKVGRNEPCTCGSGIKFKKCCGR
jgi:hypothetical protein